MTHARLMELFGSFITEHTGACGLEPPLRLEVNGLSTVISCDCGAELRVKCRPDQLPTYRDRWRQLAEKVPRDFAFVEEGGCGE